MSRRPTDDRWAAGDAYELYMGRWSRPLAERFVEWLAPEPGLTWLDVGCGTAAVAAAICRLAAPAAVIACDPSVPFVDHASARMSDPRVSVVVAGVDSLPERPGGFDRVVSALVLNFLPDPGQAVARMRARTCPGGVVAACVWDYADRMELLRVFWDEAVAVDPAARTLDEGVRFPLCQPAALEFAFRDAGTEDVRSGALEIPTRFESFADYWAAVPGRDGPGAGVRGIPRPRQAGRAARPPRAPVDPCPGRWHSPRRPRLGGSGRRSVTGRPTWFRHPQRSADAGKSGARLGHRIIDRRNGSISFGMEHEQTEGGPALTR